MTDYTIAVKFAMIFFMVTMALEWVIGKVMKKSIYNPMDTISSVSSGMTNNIKSILKLSVVIVSYQWMYDHFALFSISNSWWVYLLAFLGIDFAYYWTHRWNHEFNILWNQHIIHHSSEEYNLACALRQSISDLVKIYFFLYFPLAIIGIPTEVISVLLPLHLFAQFWYHTRLIGKMGFLENIIVTPSHHRVHHAINDKYIDKNYASIFIFWDFIFGSFQKELAEEPPVYGIKKPANTWNPIIINFMHLFLLFKDAFRTKNWVDKLKIWFMPTGWRPKDVIEKYPIEIIEKPHEYTKYQTKKDNYMTMWCSFQLALHLGMQFHFIYLISYLLKDSTETNINPIIIFQQYEVLIFYGLFFFLSIWSYTTLMDRSRFSIVVELIKTTVGLFLVYKYPVVLNIYEGISLPENGIYAYLIISLLISCFYQFVFTKEKKELSLFH